MSSINTHVGKMIRKYRKAANLTLQQLADAIHKSRATICKYENGDISMDIETLYEISQVLQVSVPQLTDIGRLQEEADHSSAYAARKSPFFQAKMLYFYFYDGRYNRMKDGVINIHEKEGNGSYRATLSICSVSGNGRSSESYYNGSVLYSDMLIRFSFVNQYNPRFGAPYEVAYKKICVKNLAVEQNPLARRQRRLQKEIDLAREFPDLAVMLGKPPVNTAFHVQQPLVHAVTP